MLDKTSEDQIDYYQQAEEQAHHWTDQYATGEQYPEETADDLLAELDGAVSDDDALL